MSDSTFVIFSIISEVYLDKKNNKIRIDDIISQIKSHANLDTCYIYQNAKHKKWSAKRDNKISKLLSNIIPHLPIQKNSYNINKIISLTSQLFLWKTAEIIIKRHNWTNIDIALGIADLCNYNNNKEIILQFMKIIKKEYSKSEVYNIVKLDLHDTEHVHAVISIACSNTITTRLEYLYYIYAILKSGHCMVEFTIGKNAKQAKRAILSLIEDERCGESLRGAWIFACIVR